MVLKPKYQRWNGEISAFTVGGVLQKKTKAKGVYTVELEVELPAEVFSPKQMKAAIKLEREDVESQVKVTPTAKIKIQRKGAFWQP